VARKQDDTKTFLKPHLYQILAFEIFSAHFIVTSASFSILAKVRLEFTFQATYLPKSFKFNIMHH
jgi:hypothetical protein